MAIPALAVFVAGSAYWSGAAGGWLKTACVAALYLGIAFPILSWIAALVVLVIPAALEWGNARSWLTGYGSCVALWQMSGAIGLLMSWVGAPVVWLFT